MSKCKGKTEKNYEKNLNPLRMKMIAITAQHEKDGR